jgi:hypothetical protein
MRNVIFLILILGICIFRVAERFQNKLDDQVATMDTAPVQAAPEEGDRKNHQAKRKPEPAEDIGLSHALDSGVASAQPLPRQSLSQDNMPDVPSVQWDEADAFLRHMEKNVHDLEAEDVDRFNALIREAGRIAQGLPPDLRQQFKDELFVIIDEAYEPPPLPEDVIYEFEKE